MFKWFFDISKGVRFGRSVWECSVHSCSCPCLRLNLSKERILDGNIRAMALQCPKLQYLNICETMASYEVFETMASTWKNTMIYICLPHQMAVTLAVDSDTVVTFNGLEDLTSLWQSNQINAQESPELAMLVQFKSMVDDMTKLKFLHMGDWNGQMPYDFLGTQSICVKQPGERGPVLPFLQHRIGWTHR